MKSNINIIRPTIHAFC